MTDCGYCDFGITLYCDARNPRHGFVCTRPAGHNGPHVACISTSGERYDQHEVAEWTDEDAERYSSKEFTPAGGDAV